MSLMKWWGWGDKKTSFDISSRPHLLPYILNAAGLKENELKLSSPCEIDEVSLPDCQLNEAFIAALEHCGQNVELHFDKEARLSHAYGKSFRDLWRIRRGIIQSAPDCVCYPESEEALQALICAAVAHHVVIIPYGGGTNIAGCLEALNTNGKMCVSVDMRRMNRVLEVDAYSMTARIQAGALGPYLEAALNKQGFTLGHFPDSFEYSSIGGWVATRSAGMQSDKYGKIEDMVISLRMISPSGVLQSRTVPKSSNGINVNHLAIGSEGILGIITEVTVQIHALPEYKCSLGYLFPHFRAGVEAMHACVRKGLIPDMSRLNDADKTALSFAFQHQSSLWKRLQSKVFKAYLTHIKHFNLDNVALMLVTFIGQTKAAKTRRKQVEAIYRAHGAIPLGEAPGHAFELGKYDFPYLRDYLMDIGCTSDVSETATPWANVLPLYEKTKAKLHKAIEQTGVKPWSGCHISHTYHTGASLYFTFAFEENETPLAQYDVVKQAAEQAFMSNGGTLSHHHAVGYEHQPWLEEDISAVGIKALCGLKQALDAKGIMNPGKLISARVPSDETN